MLQLQIHCPPENTNKQDTH